MLGITSFPAYSLSLPLLIALYWKEVSESIQTFVAIFGKAISFPDSD